MAAFFKEAETQYRPGVYFRYENSGTPIEAGATDGVCAAVIKSNTGAAGEVILLENIQDVTENYGEAGTTEVLREMFRGGASKVYAINLGNNDKTYGAAEYEKAFKKLAPYRWNVISIDTIQTTIQTKLKEHLEDVYQNDGKFVMGVVGSNSIDTEKKFDDYRMVHVVSGFKYSTNEEATEYVGYLAAARVAGMIAGTPSNQSITHKVIKGAVELTNPLTNSEHVEAIKAGLLTFSTSPSGAIWVESGINTLTNTGAQEDEGWMKIKRTKIRFELMQRINDTIDNLIGKVNNNPDGRATIMQAAQGVCNSMISEKKLLEGAIVMEDDNPTNAPKGDSAWFLVLADDIDSLEKMFYTFKFRFKPEVELPDGGLSEEEASVDPTEA